MSSQIHGESCQPCVTHGGGRQGGVTCAGTAAAWEGAVRTVLVTLSRGPGGDKELRGERQHRAQGRSGRAGGGVSSSGRGAGSVRGTRSSRPGRVPWASSLRLGSPRSGLRWASAWQSVTAALGSTCGRWGAAEFTAEPLSPCVGPACPVAAPVRRPSEPTPSAGRPGRQRVPGRVTEATPGPKACPSHGPSNEKGAPGPRGAAAPTTLRGLGVGGSARVPGPHSH